MTSYSDTLQHGDMIGCYQIEDVLGRGGFAVTYLAIDLNLDVHVAIKEYLPREIIQRDSQLNVSARRPEFAEDYNIGLSNFAREAKTLARFKHVNIVRVHQVIHKYNTAYMVMDYEQGRELADVLEEHKIIGEDDLRQILFPIFDGVQEIHRAGLAHRDIKPSNIYLRDNGSPVLLDFGAARYTMSETTQQLTAVVTVGYTPIEQYNVSDNDQGPWSDIYALAAVLYEAVTGEMPVDSVTRASSTLTRSEDPLLSVSNKAQQHYSDNFLAAIDWGLHMEAEDRPQSIAQWRAAFDGDIRPASDFVQKKPPGRPSRLKTRGKYPPTDDQRTEQPPFDQPQAAHLTEKSDPRLSVDLRTAELDDSIDDVELIPLHASEQYSANRSGPSARDRQTYQSAESERSRTSADQNHVKVNLGREEPTLPPRINRSPFSNNPADTPSETENPASMQAANRNTIEPDTADQPPVEPASTLNDTLNNIADNTATTTHTQELRNVLRRDIVKRPSSPEPEDQAPAPQTYPAPYRVANKRNSGSLLRDAQGSTSHAQIATQDAESHRPVAEQQPPGRAPARADIEFDESDWDYEPPSPPSKWGWLLTATGLLAVVGGALLYVNKPELFRLPTASGPDMTVATALEKAQQHMNDEALIFPAGQSALDYYQLILSSEPDNPQALEGVATIAERIKRRIIENIEADDLNEANNLLARANESGLQIDGLPASPTAEPAEPQPAAPDSGPIAIDTTASPWVTGKIADIKQLISDGKFAEAETLFEETDKYLSDAELSTFLRTQIEDGKAGRLNPAAQNLPAPDRTTEPSETRAESLDTDLPLNIESTDSNTGDQTNEIATSTVDTTETSVEIAATDRVGQETSPDVPVVITPEPTTTPQPPVNTAPQQLPSAPRRSFIEGNNATSQHLNQLRLAIEAKSLRRVLDVSDALADERTEFLRKMFQRYDRLDVTIDDISTGSNSATARLSVAMFNQRGDGSFYSAGRWNGVTLTAIRQNGTWQKIQW